MSKVISVVGVEQKILFIRNQKVMLSLHLAEFYEVPAKVLLQAVKRNIERFPHDFMFQLSWDEVDSLRSQRVTLNSDNEKNSRSQIVTLKRGTNVKFLPYAFTEQGIAMLSSVLRSQRAIAVNIAIIRAFVTMRQVLATHKELADRLGELERRMGRKDQEVIALFEAIRKLMAPPPEKKKRPIGFIVEGEH
jgi:phage regulator Rha-like protein